MRSVNTSAPYQSAGRSGPFRLAAFISLAAALPTTSATAQNWSAPPPVSPYSAQAYGYPPPPPPPYYQGGYAPAYGAYPYPQATYVPPAYGRWGDPGGTYSQEPYARPQAAPPAYPAADDPYGYEARRTTAGPYGPPPYQASEAGYGDAPPPPSPEGPSRMDPGAVEAYAPPARFTPPPYGAPPEAASGGEDEAAQGGADASPGGGQPPSRPPSAPVEPLPAPAAAPAQDTGGATQELARQSLPAGPAPKSVALAANLIQSASAYLEFMNRASDISPSFRDPASVARELKTGAAYEARQFQEGAIAYAAIVALQDPSFVDGIWSMAGRDPAAADAFAERLIANPASVASIPGAAAAGASAGAALRRQADRLMQNGLKVKQAAYDVQRSAWSKADIPQPAARLAEVKSLSSTRSAPSRVETDRLLRLVLAEQGQAPDGSVAGSPTGAVQRGLALAALAVLGKAGDRDADRIAPLLTEASASECLKMAKLNLFQCMAVAGPHYEDIFCLGRHAMMDTAQCVSAAAGHGGFETASTPAPPGYWTTAASRP